MGLAHQRDEVVSVDVRSTLISCFESQWPLSVQQKSKITVTDFVGHGDSKPEVEVNWHCMETTYYSNCRASCLIDFNFWLWVAVTFTVYNRFRKLQWPTLSVTVTQSLKLKSNWHCMETTYYSDCRALELILQKFLATVFPWIVENTWKTMATERVFQP